MQKNLRDIPSKKKKTVAFDGSTSSSEIFEEEQQNIRLPIKLTPFGDIIPQGIHYKNILYKGKKSRGVTILGAAGEEQVPVQKLKIISDPYSSDTRKDFTSLALTDPVIAPALSFRRGALFEDGFTIKLKLASQYNPQTGEEYTPDEIKVQLAAQQQIYAKYLLQINTWKDEMALDLVAKDFETVSIPHGKAAGLIYPGIMELPQGKLPVLFEIIPADDLGDPIIDVSLTRDIVACKLNLEDKKFARKDELVYFTRGLGGLRREYKFHGTSAFEPILIISRAVKRFYNLDAPLAMIASYITRLLIKVDPSGDEDELQARIDDFMANLFKASNWAVAMPEWYAGVDTIQPKVDYPMFDGLENKLASVELNQLGVPKATQNREQNVNRDTLTIQAINFIRFFRKPAEKEIKETFENQLLNPLLAHQIGRPLSEIPVRYEIVRKIPEEGDIDSMYDKLAEKKNDELDKQSMIQSDAKSPFGASANKQNKTMDQLSSEISEISKQVTKLKTSQEDIIHRNFILKEKREEVLDLAKTAISNLVKQ